LDRRKAITREPTNNQPVSRLRAALESAKTGSPPPPPIRPTKDLAKPGAFDHFCRELIEAIEDQKKIVAYLDGKMIQDRVSYSTKFEAEKVRLTTLLEVLAQTEVSKKVE